MAKTIFIILIFFVFSSSCFASDPFSEALLSLKSELIIPSENVLNDWKIQENQTPSSKIIACSWTGIKCDENMTKITSLDLSFKNLGGVLSHNQFGQFLDLIDLNISHNSFSDQIPVGIFNLSNLKTLDISRNNFSGVFPSGISKLENLVVFDAFSNSFSGSLPKDVCEIWSLKVLNFAGSYFSGSIPSEYGYCKSLEFLHLGGNFLTGNLPKEFGQLKNIVHMEIGYNMYEGGIPWEFGNMSQLQYLDIADANLSGPIPKDLGNLTKLDTLFLFKNRLSGMIPTEFGDILTLSSLDVSDNMLTGPIPESFSNLKNLKLLSVMYNDMNGSVPDGIAKLPNLESLLIWDNFFSGELPQELGKYSKLKWVDVSTNDFVGVIPPDICSGGELSRLMLFSNYFSGGLSSLSNCSSLVRVRLEDNLFSGGIPFDIFHATNLEHFNVSSNPSLGGILPEKIWSLPVLQNLSAIFCNISGIVPGFQSCKLLYVIELNGNHLSGTIPESLSVCENLGMLNLAENNLSGEIPVKLGSSSKLKFLNLSYNDLSGSIPMENSFKAMDSNSFLGNPNLCGAPLARPCHHGKAISEGLDLGSRSHKVAWVIVLCAVVVLLVCFLIGIVYYRRHNVNRHWRMVSFGGLPELTAADVLKSFDSVEAVETPYSSNSVCKAVLLTGMTVIVRKIEWGTKSSNLLMDFINRLGNSQHKNLIRLLGFCYNKNLGYLLYEYLPNGDLDEKIGVKRDWGSKQRLVVNIAKGLCFLHHDCRPAIPHGNLKASNIVFDENMEPHLAEFAFKTISAMETGDYKGLMEHELTDDIFDFGEVVLEILTNCKRKNGGVMIHRTPREVLLKEIYQANEVDSSSSSKSIQEEIKLVFEVVLRCTTSKQTDRPSMEEVLKILSGLKPEKK
uniref:leucine-rich repeat receptor-like protein kinase TDR n=1 Tax=Erigeron canadensis TaxID=72917 RepID=UPI001CB8D706|nr:leucine-rich repeat receptor-like protein kinase TDR [Erigeron canadensis]